MIWFALFLIFISGAVIGAMETKWRMEATHQRIHGFCTVCSREVIEAPSEEVVKRMMAYHQEWHDRVLDGLDKMPPPDPRDPTTFDGRSA